MTKEQIEELRSECDPNLGRVMFMSHPTFGKLLDLAERALVLEEVLAAAKRYCKSETGSDGALLYKFLRAAIDRAEGR